MSFGSKKSWENGQIVSIGHGKLTFSLKGIIYQERELSVSSLRTFTITESKTGYNLNLYVKGDSTPLTIPILEIDHCVISFFSLIEYFGCKSARDAVTLNQTLNRVEEKVQDKIRKIIEEL